MLYVAALLIGAAVGTVGWYVLAGRYHDRVVKDLLSENGDLSQRLSEATYYRNLFRDEAKALRARLDKAIERRPNGTYLPKHEKVEA